MAIDYTDFVIVILDSGERVFHRTHIQNWKGLGKEPYSFHNRHYNLMLDRAYRIRWAPWIFENIKWKKPWILFREITRKKKIGLLIFQETEEPTEELIDPIHISRVAQPSGRLDDEPGHPHNGLVDKISPFVLKMIVDASAKYRKAYKSYAFGLKQRLMSNWVLLLIIGIVAIFMLLYLTGYIRI